MSKKINLLIADDHKLISQALASFLKSVANYEIYFASSYYDINRHSHLDNLDLLLLDLRMPGMNGLSSICEVVRKHEQTSVVLFTGATDDAFLQECFACGVRGYIPKSMDVDAVHIALQLISAGQIYVPYENFTYSSSEKNSGKSNLNERELMVLKLAADGYTNKEIARDLASNETYIKMIMRNICAKLGAKNRANACMTARERLLI